VEESVDPAAITAAMPIVARSFPVIGADYPALLESGMSVIMVIDSAGTVRSASPIGTTERQDIDLMSALSQWKFVPTFKGRRAVASRTVKTLSLKQ